MFFDPREPLTEQQILSRYQAARLGGQPDSALKWLGLLLAQNPGNSRLAFMMGRTLLSAGRYDEAEAWLAKGIDHHLKDGDSGNSGDREPLCIIGMPRSASSNLTKTLARLTGRPSMELGFGELAPRLDVTLQPAYLNAFVRGGYASHSHLNPKRDTLALLAEKGIRKIFVQLRDPRQAVASFRIYSLKSPEILSRLNYVYPGYSFLPAEEQMLLLYKTYYPSLLAWLGGWERAQKERWSGIEIFVGRFEDMERSPAIYRAALSEFLDIALEDVPALREDGRRTPGPEEWRQHLGDREQDSMDQDLAALASGYYRS